MIKHHREALLTATALSPTTAVIYCRVSSKKQATSGDGLASQETRCREYANFKGYQVEAVFHETLTGGSSVRPAMASLIAHLRAHKKDGPRVVIVDSQTRFAKDVIGHWHLREALKKAGGILESPSQNFGDSSHDRLLETVLAAGAQYQRELNAEQTRDRMDSRAKNGYWPFQAPVGYRHERVAGHKGKLLVRDEPLASIVQEGLEGYASGHFRLKAEVKRFFEQHPAFPRCAYGGVTNQWVNQILNNPIYAGYVEAPKWNVSLRKGQHTGLISLETHQRITGRSQEDAYAPARADLNLDFPLRGIIACCDCAKPLTGYWSSPRTSRRYAYYMCFNKDCTRHRKSVKRDVVEGEFAALLERVTPSEKLTVMVSELFKDAWQQRASQAAALLKACGVEMTKVQKEIDSVLDRLVQATSQSVIAAYERRVADLEKARLVLEERRSKNFGPLKTFEEMFERAMSFLAAPANLWKSGTFSEKQLVLRLTFADRLAYCPKNGFRTPKMSFPFKVLESIAGGEIKLARPKRFELLTPKFVV